MYGCSVWISKIDRSQYNALRIETNCKGRKELTQAKTDYSDEFDKEDKARVNKDS